MDNEDAIERFERLATKFRDRYMNGNRKYTDSTSRNPAQLSSQTRRNLFDFNAYVLSRQVDRLPPWLKRQHLTFAQNIRELSPKETGWIRDYEASNDLGELNQG